jgi:hypothetical protein
MLNARCVGVKSCPSNGFGRKKKNRRLWEFFFSAVIWSRVLYVRDRDRPVSRNQPDGRLCSALRFPLFFFRFHNLTDWWTAEGSPTLIIIKIKTASRSDNLSLFRKREKIITRWCMLKSSREILPVAILRKKNSNNSIPSCWTTIRLWNCCLTTNQQTAKR